jgi:hypothetical protein
MLAFDAMYGKGAMSVRLTLKQGRLFLCSTHGGSVGMSTSYFEQPLSSPNG